MASVQISLEAVLKYLSLGMGISGVLQLAGFVSPGWFRYRTEGYRYTIHIGLWYEVRCAETCKTTSIYKDFEDGYHSFRPWQIQTTIALLACLIVIICLIMARNVKGARQFKRLTIVAYCSLMSGLLSLVPAGNYADIQISLDGTDKLFPYSLLLTGLGGIIALVTSLISLYVVLSNQTTNELESSYPDSDTIVDILTLADDKLTWVQFIVIQAYIYILY